MKIPDRPEQHLLRHVLGILLMTQYPVTKAINILTMATHELSHGFTTMRKARRD
ncbi:hypothetical protein [Lacunimicrobium album]